MSRARCPLASFVNRSRRYGTAPATGYRMVPFASTTLGSEQPLIASELLGQRHDPLAPIKDAVTADGDAVVPIDVENLGLWLKAAFGAPVTSGTTPKTHTFQSGNWTLPSMAIETAMPEVPRYAKYTGCVCDQLSWQMARSGLLTATARLVAQGESVAAATAAGTPTSLVPQRFGHFNGAIRTPTRTLVSSTTVRRSACSLIKDHARHQAQPCPTTLRCADDPARPCRQRDRQPGHGDGARSW